MRVLVDAPITPAALAAARRVEIVSWDARPNARASCDRVASTTGSKNGSRVTISVRVVAFAVVSMDRARRLKGLARLTSIMSSRARTSAMTPGPSADYGRPRRRD